MDSRRFLMVLAVTSAVVVFVVLAGKKDAPKGEPVKPAAPAAVVAAKPAGTQPAAPAVEAAAAPTASQPGRPLWTATGRNDQNPADPEIAFIGNLDPASGFPFELRLNSRDAGIQTVLFSQYYETVADKKLAAKHAGNHQAYMEAWKKNAACGGHYVGLRSARMGQELFEPYGTRVTQVSLADGTSIALPGGFDWQLASAPAPAAGEAQTARWHMAVLRNNQKVLQAVKTYTVRKNDYTLVMTVELTNPSDQAVTVSLDQFGPTGVRHEDTRADDLKVIHGRLDDNRVQPVTDAPKELENLTPGQKHYLGTSDEAKAMLWIGYVNKFFGSMVYLVPKNADLAKTSRQAADYGAKFYLAKLDEGKSPRLLTGMEFPGVKINPGKTETITFEIYAGPKSVDVFTSDSDTYFRQRYQDLSYVGTVDLGSCPVSFCVWNWLTLAMMWLLRKLSAVGNYGIAIILLVIIVRILLHPLSRKSQVSMMKMQKLQPLMAQLKEKYKDDKDTLQKETMKLYKEHKVNPIGGCLPMLIQIPVMIALYYVLRCAIELRFASFLWITDLSEPENLLAGLLPLPLRILPLLMAATMFWQQRMMPSTADPVQ
ncbi:MAG: YidC/Oxa1 family insertase periplasmic-domain containing protein, partial [Planctomycetota bacterium]